MQNKTRGKLYVVSIIVGEREREMMMIMMRPSFNGDVKLIIREWGFTGSFSFLVRRGIETGLGLHSGVGIRLRFFLL